MLGGPSFLHWLLGFESIGNISIGLSLDLLTSLQLHRKEAALTHLLSATVERLSIIELDNNSQDIGDFYAVLLYCYGNLDHFSENCFHKEIALWDFTEHFTFPLLGGSENHTSYSRLWWHSLCVFRNKKKSLSFTYFQTFTWGFCTFWYYFLKKAFVRAKNSNWWKYDITAKSYISVFNLFTQRLCPLRKQFL